MTKNPSCLPCASCGLSRRTFLAGCAACVGAATALPSGLVGQLFGDETRRTYRVGIRDKDIGFMANPESFAQAKSMGFQGVQVFYTLDGEFSLRKPENRVKYVETAKKENMGIASLVTGDFIDRSFVQEMDTEEWVSDCMDAMNALGTKCVLLPFFEKSDIKDKKADQDIVIEKLKRLAPKAEKLGFSLAIESWLNAEDHVRIIDAVGSKAIQVYYDIQNGVVRGYDIFQEITQLGQKKLIAQVHLKCNGRRLENSPIDMKRVRDTLRDVGYEGWLVVEGSVEGDRRESQIANAAFTKKLFEID